MHLLVLFGIEGMLGFGDCSLLLLELLVGAEVLRFEEPVQRKSECAGEVAGTLETEALRAFRLFHARNGNGHRRGAGHNFQAVIPVFLLVILEKLKFRCARF